MLLFVAVVLLGFDLVGVVSLCKKRNGEMVTAVIAFCNDMLVGHGEGNVVIVGQGEEIHSDGLRFSPSDVAKGK
jgi:hypothetical protein